MKKKISLQNLTHWVFGCVALLFVVLFAVISQFENNQVINHREDTFLIPVENYTMELVEDPNAPQKVHNVYTWILSEEQSQQECLGFYLVHQYADVYIDDELVYSLQPDEKDIMGASPSSNWVFVSLDPEDQGRQVRIVVTPVYSDFILRKIDFETGTRYDMLQQTMRNDFIQIILAVLCIALGLMFVIYQVIQMMRKKDDSWSIFYLGVFSILIGIWRLTDTRLSPMLFAGNTKALGYITLGALFSACAPFMMFVKDQFSGRRKQILQLVALANSVVALIALLLQLLNIVELRSILVYCHIMVALSMLTLVIVSLPFGKNKKEIRGSWEFTLLLTTGVLLDIYRYYQNKSSASIFFTIVAFLIYASIKFIRNFFLINRRAYTDMKTGLYNRSHWDEMMKNPPTVSHPFGIIMIDLNNLKKVNDTFGHDIGDTMIIDFANLLQHSFSKEHTLCRWGGDEFTVMVYDATEEKILSYMKKIDENVERYNASHEPVISYSAGWALSSCYPELRAEELFEMADEKMYQNKKQWHLKEQ